MTKHSDSSRSTDHDSSAPNSPELTRLSGEQAEERTAREGRWEKLRKHAEYLLEIGSHQSPVIGPEEFIELLSECSRLASRVEELEKCLRGLTEFPPPGQNEMKKRKNAARRLLAVAHAEEKPNG